MSRGEDYASFDGDDEKDTGAASFGESPADAPSFPGPSGGDGGARRKRSRSGMVARSSQTGSHKQARGKSKGFRFNAGLLREAAGSMITVAVTGVAVCAIILYFTFVQTIIPQFYGALGAAMVIMFLLCFVAARLLAAES